MSTDAPPKTLDDLLKILPGLTRVRSLNADWLRKLLDRQRRECTWCGQLVGKYRSTWCSDACVQAFKERCCPQTQQRLVEQRDKWICQLCGRNVRDSRRDGMEAWKVARPQYSGSWKDLKRHEDEIYAQYGHARGRWHEVDHILPVIEGGGLLGIENLRLICGTCHAEVTKALAGRRAAGTNSGTKSA